MADTYFGYKERDASAQINWAEVGKGFSDTLNKEAQRREQQKQQIDDATREYQKVLADAPKGQSDALNGLSADFADQVSNNMLMVNRLLKSGQLSVKDFTRIRQNMIDNTDLMYTVLGDANKYFATHMERINNGTASAMEAQNMERIENLANLKNTRTYVDPETGLVSLGKLKEVNGVLELDKAPGSFMTINQLRDNLNTFYNKFDVDGKLKEKEVALGQVTESIVQLSNVAGGLNTILTTSDKKLGEYGLSDDEKEIVQNYRKYEDEMLKEFTTNPVQLASILIDYVGDYQIEFDKEKFDKDKTANLFTE